jgi:hypothetical protein
MHARDSEPPRCLIGMRKHWRVLLPILGLLLFGGESYVSVQMDREHPLPSRRYFWWSSIRLDTDPLGRQSPLPATRKIGDGVSEWDPVTRWVDPGWLAKSLMVSALPAFAVSALAVGGLGRLGISEVSSFMALMPLLIAGWYYTLGLLIDHRIYRRSHRVPIMRKTANDQQPATSDCPSGPTPALPSAGPSTLRPSGADHAAETPDGR